MRNAPEVVREVGVYDVRVATVTRRGFASDPMAHDLPVVPAAGLQQGHPGAQSPKAAATKLASEPKSTPVKLARSPKAAPVKLAWSPKAAPVKLAQPGLPATSTCSTPRHLHREKSAESPNLNPEKSIGACDTSYPGQHEAILDPELCQIVQDKLTTNRRERSLAVGAEAPSLLAGLIVDSDGNRMTPTHATKKVKRYCYYVSAPLLAGEGLRVSAGDIEALVLDRLRALLSSRTDVSETARAARS
jgi:hypothetical protein